MKDREPRQTTDSKLQELKNRFLPDRDVVDMYIEQALTGVDRQLRIRDRLVVFLPYDAIPISILPTDNRQDYENATVRGFHHPPLEITREECADTNEFAKEIRSGRGKVYKYMVSPSGIGYLKRCTYPEYVRETKRYLAGYRAKSDADEKLRNLLFGEE